MFRLLITHKNRDYDIEEIFPMPNDVNIVETSDVLK